MIHSMILSNRKLIDKLLSTLLTYLKKNLLKYQFSRHKSLKMSTLMV